MDRFIVSQSGLYKSVVLGLKSNMDRFIAHMHRNHFQNRKSLKSNMDRFIADSSSSYSYYNIV